MMKNKNKLRGKKARQSGKVFELRTRKDLESLGWFVAKYMNNIQLPEFKVAGTKNEHLIEGKLIPAKNKFRGLKIPMMLGSGFPDFICHRTRILSSHSSKEIPNILYEVIGVESKTDGYLDKVEKSKCEWLLKNKIFSRILIAYKTKEGRKVIVKYKEFKSK